jgi:hypothetical protein
MLVNAIQNRTHVPSANPVRMVMLLALLAMPPIALGQNEQQATTFVVSGSLGEASIRQMNGLNYVDLESLARITKGSLTFQGNRVVLTLPASSVVRASPAVPVAGAPADPGFSREFRMAAIEAVATIREWVSTLAVAMQNGYPIGNAMASYRARAIDSLRLASVTASTTADRRALQLLNRKFDHAQNLSSQLVSARNSLAAADFAMSPETMNNDAVFQQIVRCGHSLGAMLAGGAFVDDAACQ